MIHVLDVASGKFFCQFPTSPKAEFRALQLYSVNEMDDYNFKNPSFYIFINVEQILQKHACENINSHCQLYAETCM